MRRIIMVNVPFRGSLATPAEQSGAILARIVDDVRIDSGALRIGDLMARSGLYRGNWLSIGAPNARIASARHRVSAG
jgi:hypothetical protein